MAGCSRSSFGLGRSTFRAGQAGLLFGFEPCSRSPPDLDFLLGTATGFPRLLLLGGDSRKRRGLGGLFGAESVIRQISRTPLRISPFPGQTGEFLFLACSSGSRGSQLGGGKFAALGVGQRALFRLDFRAQRDFGQALDMHLLRRCSLGSSLRSSAAQGLFRSKIVGLQAALCRRSLLGGLELARFGSGPGALVRGGPRQSLGFCRPLGVYLIAGGYAAEGDLATLPLQIHQSRQDFAHAWLPITGKACKPDCGSLTQSRQGPKVE
jgi:hypothetical protein